MRASTLIVTGAVGAALWEYTMNQPRGIRNNNPLNIRQTRTVWRGESHADIDPAFEEFDDVRDGIRAGALLIKTYRRVHGLSTLGQIIYRWAPPSENDTDAYVRAVSVSTGFAPDRVITDDDLPSLIAAMIKHENGVQPYTLAQIIDGVSRA